MTDRPFESEEPMPPQPKLTRSLIKHIAEPTVYVIETDEDGMILNALDVTNEATGGGLCPHVINDLPLAGRIEDVELLNRERDEQWQPYVPDCGNIHHLMTDLLAFEREHRAAAQAFAMADSRAKGLRKELDLKSQKVHELLGRIADRKPAPLFEAAGL
jgi:hypothetical protein